MTPLYVLHFLKPLIGEEACFEITEVHDRCLLLFCSYGHSPQEL